MRIDFNRRVETGRWYQLLLSFSKPAGVFYFSHKSYHSFSLHSSDIHATKLHTFLKSWTHLTSRFQNILHEKFSKNYMLHPTMASLLKYESLLEFQTGKLAVSWFRAFQMSPNIPKQVFIKIYYLREKIGIKRFFVRLLSYAHKKWTRYMSLFAQIAEHQICKTGILIAFKGLSRQETYL